MILMIPINLFLSIFHCKASRCVQLEIDRNANGAFPTPTVQMLRYSDRNACSSNSTKW